MGFNLFWGDSFMDSIYYFPNKVFSFLIPFNINSWFLFV
ncbi:MAG: hypothetical protein A4E49_02841 [Methanosaeta sp. PtaU1.Bin112]|nr:MAG: hypothetical protein A4E49_02841 [Methanosaeta sp. PtaU1.Bin112]